MLDGSRDVGLYEIRLRLGHVRHVLELVVASGDAGRAAEVVDRNRREAALGEPEGELLVEAVQAADVREDRDPDRGRLLRNGPERSEPVAVRGAQDEVVVGDSRAGEDGDRGQGVGVEAHRRNRLTGRRPSRNAVVVSAMAEQSHRDEMNAAIRAQRERKAAPRSIASEPAQSHEPPPEPPAAPEPKSLFERLRGK